MRSWPHKEAIRWNRLRKNGKPRRQWKRLAPKIPADHPIHDLLPTINLVLAASSDQLSKLRLHKAMPKRNRFVRNNQGTSSPRSTHLVHSSGLNKGRLCQPSHLPTHSASAWSPRSVSGGSCRTEEGRRCSQSWDDGEIVHGWRGEGGADGVSAGAAYAAGQDDRDAVSRDGVRERCCVNVLGTGRIWSKGVGRRPIYWDQWAHPWNGQGRLWIGAQRMHRLSFGLRQSVHVRQLRRLMPALLWSQLREEHAFWFEILTIEPISSSQAKIQIAYPSPRSLPRKSRLPCLEVQRSKHRPRLQPGRIHDPTTLAY